MVALHGSIEIVGSIPVLSLTGSVDLATVADLRDLLLRLAAEHPGQSVVVDLEGVDTLDDTGLGVLLGAAGRARENGGDVRIVSAKDHVRRRFRFTGLDRAITVAPSVAALASATLDEVASDDSDAGDDIGLGHGETLSDESDDSDAGDSRELYHIALVDDWTAAKATGEYTTSTRGRTLAEEGFIHCSFADQLEATADRFYADVTDAVVLRIDRGRLPSRVVVEDLVGTGERFPHVYGPIPVAAVAGVRPLRPPAGTA